MQSRFLVMGVAALFLATPFGLVAANHGDWLGTSGSYEPSTRWDTDGYMFQKRNVDPVERVYFNGIVLSSTTGGVFHQPNLDGGTVMGAAANYAVAVLGFWRDCNKDGYIGARSAPSVYGSFSAYPRALYPIDETVCPPGSPYNMVNPATGQPDGLIDEFRWIAPGAGCDPYKAGCPGSASHSGTRVCPGNAGVCVERYADYPNDVNAVTDNRSRVWGDWNFPGGLHIPSQGLYPMPRGTFQDSHGTLKWVDDALQREVSKSLGETWTSKPNVGGGCVEPKPAFSLDPTGSQCGYWPLYQVKRLHNDSSCYEEKPSAGRPDGCSKADPIVRTWSYNEDGRFDNPCDGGFRHEIANDPTRQGRTSVVAFPQPKVGADSVNPNFLADGSVAGTWRHQMRALNATTGREGKCGSQQGTFEDSGCNVTVNLECESQEASFLHIQPDFLFNYTNGTSRRALAQFGFDAMPGDQFGAGAQGVTNNIGPGYFSTTTYSHRPPRTGWGYTVNAFASFYADVSTQSVCLQPCPVPTNNPLADARTALPGGAQDRYWYGLESCPGGDESGINEAISWSCSRAAWLEFRKAAGEANRFDPVLGDRYDLRDVDCHDNTVAADTRLGVADCAPYHR